LILRSDRRGSEALHWQDGLNWIWNGLGYLGFCKYTHGDYMCFDSSLSRVSVYSGNFPAFWLGEWICEVGMDEGNGGLVLCCI